LLFSSLFPEGLSGVLASAPMIEAGSFTKPNSAELMLMRSFVPSTLPNLVIPTKIDINNISRDPEQMKMYNEDELIHGWGCVGLLTEVVISCGELLTKHYQSFSHPLLITHGALDTLTCPEASKKFVDTCRSTDKKHILFPGYVHELHNEPLDDRKKVYETYQSWILERSK
jgi:alpha-beta hydrolase superfamily lysophospholipase